VPDTTPAPTLLVRLPYSKDLPALLGYGLVPNLFALVEAGYAVAYQDCRGTFRSAGEFTPMLNEPDDGADTVAWHTIQSWSTQMALAESLRQLGRGAGDPQLLADLGAMMADPQPHLEALPPSRQPLLEKVWPWWSDLLTHPGRDQFWQDLSVLDGAEQVTVPALHIGGWFDIFAANTARSFTELRSRAGTAEAREGQRLIIGPWDHLNSTGIYPDRRFGLTADAITQDLTSEHLRFFDRWLRGRAGRAGGSAPVKIFVIGIDQWREEQDWPLPDTSYESWYLHSSGRASTAAGDGRLSPGAPGDTATDTYLYDPLRPVPSLGGRIMLPTTANAAGAVDQRPVEARDDVLCFTSEVLTEPVEVTGHVSLTLFASSSAPDTDFTGKLVDVFPDGRAIFLTDGILRARYRNSLDEPGPLAPGSADPPRHPPLNGAARASTPVSTSRVTAGSITSSISNAIAVLSALPRAYCSATSSS
jgi:putative CocE/NonD family hydrolase